MTAIHASNTENHPTINGSVIREFMPASDNPEEPPLIVLHGIGSGANHWGAFPRKLGRHVIAVDVRSAHSNPAHPSIDDYARAVEHVIAEKAPDRQVDILGLSLGGVLAQAVALRDRKRPTGDQHVKRLIQMATIPGYFKRNPTSRAQAAMHRVDTKDRITPADAAIMFGGDFINKPELANDLGITQPVILSTLRQQRDALARYIGNRQMMAMSGADHFLAFIPGMTNINKNPLTSITVPTLVVGGEADPMTPWENSQEIARLIPGVKDNLYQIPNGGHLFALTQPDLTAEIVNDFLDQD